MVSDASAEGTRGQQRTSLGLSVAPPVRVPLQRLRRCREIPCAARSTEPQVRRTDRHALRARVTARRPCSAEHAGAARPAGVEACGGACAVERGGLGCRDGADEASAGGEGRRCGGGGGGRGGGGTERGRVGRGRCGAACGRGRRREVRRGCARCCAQARVHGRAAVGGVTRRRRGRRRGPSCSGRVEVARRGFPLWREGRRVLRALPRRGTDGRSGAGMRASRGRLTMWGGGGGGSGRRGSMRRTCGRPGRGRERVAQRDGGRKELSCKEGTRAWAHRDAQPARAGRRHGEGEGAAV